MIFVAASFFVYFLSFSVYVYLLFFLCHNGTFRSPRTGRSFVRPRSQAFPARPGVRVLLQAGEGAVQPDGRRPQPGGGGGVPQAPRGGESDAAVCY